MSAFEQRRVLPSESQTPDAAPAPSAELLPPAMPRATTPRSAEADAQAARCFLGMYDGEASVQCVPGSPPDGLAPLHRPSDGRVSDPTHTVVDRRSVVDKIADAIGTPFRLFGEGIKWVGEALTPDGAPRAPKTQPAPVAPPAPPVQVAPAPDVEMTLQDLVDLGDPTPDPCHPEPGGSIRL